MFPPTATAAPLTVSAAGLLRLPLIVWLGWLVADPGTGAETVMVGGVKSSTMLKLPEATAEVRPARSLTVADSATVPAASGETGVQVALAGPKLQASGSGLPLAVTARVEGSTPLPASL